MIMRGDKLTQGWCSELINVQVTRVVDYPVNLRLRHTLFVSRVDDVTKLRGQYRASYITKMSILFTGNHASVTIQSQRLIDDFVWLLQRLINKWCYKIPVVVHTDLFLDLVQECEPASSNIGLPNWFSTFLYRAVTSLLIILFKFIFNASSNFFFVTRKK